MKALLPGHCLNDFLACTPSKAVLFSMNFNGDVAEILQFMGSCVPGMALSLSPTAGAWPFFTSGSPLARQMDLEWTSLQGVSLG